MRIGIREQLGAIILLAALIGLAVISIATWITNHSFVLNIRSTRLSLTASLKAAQLASNLNLMQTSANFVSTRVLIQNALERYNNNGNDTVQNWVSAQADMDAAIGGGGSLGQALLLQTMVFPKNASGPAGRYSVLNSTGSGVQGTVPLPYDYPNGTQVYLGDEGLGYPPELYPNLTYFDEPYNSTTKISAAEYDGEILGLGSTLLIGPWLINDSTSLLSLTMPIVNNTSLTEVLGWLTVVMDARLITQVLSAQEGLDETGETLLVGPANATNKFSQDIWYATNNGNPPNNFDVEYVLPLNKSYSDRHPEHVLGTANLPFNTTQYPAIKQAVADNSGASDNSGSDVATTNEAGSKVSVGFATVDAPTMVNWVIILEQARSEVWEPIYHLRNVLLACVFATMGVMIILVFPLAHFGVRPIRRLRAATKQSVEPPGYSETSRAGSLSSFDSAPEGRDGVEEAEPAAAAVARKEGFYNPVAAWRQSRRKTRAEREEERRRRVFRIPGKVKDRKHYVKDELTDLTTTFNEMSDELMMQYEKLEERVAQRTAELELSKKAAEAANESKTLFIANISHELKTPLNGILGMCAVCMQEDDPTRLKRSLGIIYKSGDLLLNLLTDLLTFSKNQVGQQLALDEREFRLRDISSQVLAIFDKQAKDGEIDLHIDFHGPSKIEDDDMSPERGERASGNDQGPRGTGRVKDMILWGDQHRILQVVINLVSNSLKFTPSGGSVVLSIRCLDDRPDVGSRKTSIQSKQSRQVSWRNKGSDGNVSLAPSRRTDTANEINTLDKPHNLAHILANERAPSPPPGRYFYFEFEVRDTGPGIPENLQQRIFEPFVQGDLGLSKKFGGTGLGLSICSQLSKLMKGTVEVHSEVGVGSTFTMKIPLRHLVSRADSTASSTVDLPHSMRRSMSNGDHEPHTPGRHSSNRTSRNGLDDEPAVAYEANSPAAAVTANPSSIPDSQPRLVGLSQPFFAANTPMESPGSQPAAMEKITQDVKQGGRIRVLVAEDNKVNQEVVLRMLKLEDIYDVTVAKDGQEALDLVKESMTGEQGQPYNLIFMDVQMPNVDGIQSTRLIREIGYQAPIVALTAFADESNVKNCLDSGMNYFL